MGRGRESEGLIEETVRKRPERPWTAARTMEMLRRCPLAIAQRLVHCAIAVSAAVLDSVTKTMSVAPLLTAKWTGSHLLYPSVCAVSRMFIWNEQHGNVQTWVFFKTNSAASS